MSYYPGITASFRLDKPGDALATMTITMKVDQWRLIASKLSTDTYEEWPLRSAIVDLIYEAEKVFYHRSPEE